MDDAKSLLHYRIVERLGEGGMGVVYRAEDTRLGRTVALKVLRADLAADEEWNRRFEREVRVASSFSHPGIATLYDFQRDGTTFFYTMEFVEGRNLREILKKQGPLPLPELTRCALQVAEALAEAHRKGVVHRDLKPENVMESASGYYKILDFGLARFAAGDLAEPGSGSRLETVPRDTTQAGKIVGTVSYMSPEQAQGTPVDARSDVFSFGSLFYELAAGEAPFKRNNAISTFHAIVHEEARPLRELRPEASQDLERVIARCLEKDPARRYQRAADLAEDLRLLSTGSGASSGKTSAIRGYPGANVARSWQTWGVSSRKWAAATWIGLALVAGVVVGRLWLFAPAGDGAGDVAGSREAGIPGPGEGALGPGGVGSPGPGGVGSPGTGAADSRGPGGAGTSPGSPTYSGGPTDPLGGGIGSHPGMARGSGSAGGVGEPGGSATALAGSGQRSIAVSPFVNNTGDPNSAWLVQGIPEMITTALAGSGNLTVISTQRLSDLMSMAGRDGRRGMDGATATELGRWAGATMVVNGSIYKMGEEYRIDAQAYDTATGQVLAATREQGRDVFALVDRITEQLRSRLTSLDAWQPQIAKGPAPLVSPGSGGTPLVDVADAPAAGAARTGEGSGEPVAGAARTGQGAAEPSPVASGIPSVPGIPGAERVEPSRPSGPGGVKDGSRVTRGEHGVVSPSSSGFTTPGASRGTTSEAAFRHYVDGVNYYKDLRFKDGAEAFRRALDADPSFIKAQLHLGMSLLMSGDTENGLAWIQKTTRRSDRLQGRDRRVLSIIDTGYVKKNPDAAGKEAQAYAMAFPEDQEGPFWYAKGKADVAGDRFDAIRILHGVLRAEPDNLPAAAILSNQIAALGSVDEAVKILEDYRTRPPRAAAPLSKIIDECRAVPLGSAETRQAP